MSEAKIYVYYTRALGHDERWSYKFPKGWIMDGTGASPSNKRTNINDPKLYLQYELFYGSKISYDKMKKVLDEKFKSLKKKGIILRYKIRNT